MRRQQEVKLPFCIYLICFNFWLPGQKLNVFFITLNFQSASSTHMYVKMSILKVTLKETVAPMLQIGAWGVQVGRSITLVSLNTD